MIDTGRGYQPGAFLGSTNGLGQFNQNFLQAGPYMPNGGTGGWSTVYTTGTEMGTIVSTRITINVLTRVEITVKDNQAVKGDVIIVGKQSAVQGELWVEDVEFDDTDESILLCTVLSSNLSQVDYIPGRKIYRIANHQMQPNTQQIIYPYDGTITTTTSTYPPTTIDRRHIVSTVTVEEASPQSTITTNSVSAGPNGTEGQELTPIKRRRSGLTSRIFGNRKSSNSYGDLGP